MADLTVTGVATTGTTTGDVTYAESDDLSLLFSPTGAAAATWQYWALVGAFDATIPPSGIWIMDIGEGDEGEGATEDNGEAFHASMVTKPFTPSSILNRFSVKSALLIARAANTSLEVSLIPDLKEVVDTATVNLLPTYSEDHVIRTMDQLSVADMTLAQVRIEDTETPTARWNLERIELRHTPGEKGT